MVSAFSSIWLPILCLLFSQCREVLLKRSVFWRATASSKVNDTVIAGVKMSTDDVMRRLRGKRGTKVNVKVMRRGVKELLPFTPLRATRFLSIVWMLRIW